MRSAAPSYVAATWVHTPATTDEYAKAVNAPVVVRRPKPNVPFSNANPRLNGDPSSPSRQSSFGYPAIDAGWIQASTVRPETTFRDDAATLTPCASPPSSRPLPNLPPVVHEVPVVSAPVLPFPLTSAIVVPFPSLNAYAATGSLDCARATLLSDATQKTMRR